MAFIKCSGGKKVTVLEKTLSYSLTYATQSSRAKTYTAAANEYLLGYKTAKGSYNGGGITSISITPAQYSVSRYAFNSGTRSYSDVLYYTEDLKR